MCTFSTSDMMLSLLLRLPKSWVREDTSISTFRAWCPYFEHDVLGTNSILWAWYFSVLHITFHSAFCTIAQCISVMYADCILPASEDIRYFLYYHACQLSSCSASILTAVLCWWAGSRPWPNFLFLLPILLFFLLRFSIHFASYCTHFAFVFYHTHFASHQVMWN